MSADDIVVADQQPVATVRDALNELLRIAAVKDVLKQHDERVRDFLRDEAARLQAETGTAQNFKAKGLGQAYMTEPTIKPAITNPGKVQELARQSDVGVEQQYIEVASLQHDLAAGTLPNALYEALSEAGYVRSQRVLPEHWLEELVEEFEVRDGVYVHTGTGEVLEGVEARASSSPTLTYKPDSAARKRLAAEMSRRLLQVGGGDTAAVTE